MFDELKDVELYELLGVLQSATVDEIKSAYRKKALKCHPDKNPDNPKAAELFHQLTKALEVLIDSSARAAYDKVINAKKAANLRHQELDSRRKKFKEELEAREKEAELASKFKSSKTNLARATTTDEDRLKAEIERLQKEGSQQLREEVELVRQQVIKEQQNLVKGTPSQKRLKIRWASSKDDETNGGYNSENLNKIFSKYGDIEALILSTKKKGSGLVEFITSDAADKAQKYEKGLPSNPLIVEWIEKPVAPTSSNNRAFGYSNIEPHQSIFPSSNADKFVKNENSSSNNIFSTVPKAGYNSDFESLVLRQMRQAEERKRLEEELKKEDSAT